MRVLLLLAALFALSSCLWRDEREWPPSKPHPGRAVVFAPVAAGPLAASYSAARDDFPRDLADRVWLLGGSWRGYTRPALPAADDPAWDAGIPEGLRGAEMVALVTVCTLEDLSTPSGPRVRATASLRARDVASGVELFRKEGSAELERRYSPKAVAYAQQPRSLAAWQACTECTDAFAAWLRQRPDAPAWQEPEPPPRAAPATAAAPAAPIAITIEALPAGCEVLLDGRLVGTSPCTLTLPAGREVLLRLEAPGHRPWERRVMPVGDFSVRPVLERHAP